MKKFATMVLMLSMVLGLAACSNSGSSSNDNANTAESTAAKTTSADNDKQSDSADEQENSTSNEADVTNVSLTDATGKNFTVGVADGWKLMTAEEIGSMTDTADFLVNGDSYDAMGPYIQISQTTGNIDEWVEQTKNDSYVKYDGEYVINGITWYLADRVAGAEIDEKIVTVYPQNGVTLTDPTVQAMMGSIRWANENV